MCVYLRVVVMIGSDEVVSSPALRRRSWVEEPCSVDSTRSAVRAAPGRTILGRRRETGSGCTTEKIGRPATHWKSIKSWPAVLEHIVDVQIQLLKQNHLKIESFKHYEHSEADKRIMRLFTVAKIVSNH
ncbi:hypothetical protein VPH35_060298 [Triticum aestivum]